ncbi:MAG: hypothetical protein ACTSSH_01710 [Candidatus Heimdallarchaeota archaeon]
MVNENFQLAMFILSPIVLLIDAILVTSGIFRKFTRKEQSNESERTRLISMVDVMEKIGIGLGVLTLILAGYLAVNLPKVGADWINYFNPFTILFMVIIGSLMALRMLEDSPIASVIALLAGFLGAAIFSFAFGENFSGRWIYIGVFLAIDIAVFVCVRLLTKQMAMIGRVLNWFPVAIIITFACIAWGVFQIVLLGIHGYNLVIGT